MFQDLMDEYKAKLEANPAIKPRSKTYRRECLARLLKTWSELPKLDARRIGKGECEAWAGKFVKLASPSSFNNTVGTLKQVLDLAVERGIRYQNPAAGVKRTKVKPKALVLPTQAQFLALVKEIRRVPFGPGLASADLVEFLAYGGFRKGEAQFVTWADCDLVSETILVRGHPVTGTKGGEPRRVPMVPAMKRLLGRLRSERPEAQPGDSVMRVAECQGSLTRACNALGIGRITHHDLRHLFATIAIESGVDIPTVSRWLGHKDGGALAMKVYGHLRDAHSVNMAARVLFSSTPEVENAISTQLQPTHS